MGDTKKKLRSFPEDVIDEVGYALLEAQEGGLHELAKPMPNLDVYEVVSDFDGNTFRAVYTVKLGDKIYVLHVFEKKSKRGAETPKADIKLIVKRRKEAEALYRAGKENRS